MVTGGGVSDDETRLRTLLILSQVHAVHLSRENLVRTMCWRTVETDKIALIKRLIREHTRAVVAAAMASAVRARPKKRAKSAAGA